MMKQSSLPTPSPRGLLIDRRTSLRFPCNLAASGRTGGGKTGLWWPAKVRNLSTKGVSLVMGKYYSPGTVLTVKIQPKTGAASTFQAQVLHVQQDAPGQWQLGCSFLPRLGDATVTGLLQ